MNAPRRATGKALGVVLALAFAVSLCGPGAAAAESVVPLDPFEPNLEDKPSLQRGMRLFVNYCLGCHSLKFQRYERTADDLDIPHDVALQNLVFTGQAIGDLMETAMPPEGAKNWFGAPPPDLTMVDRVRGSTWIYNMLKSFYVDESRPFGVNNLVFNDIAMPHVLMDLQGVPELHCRGMKPIDVLAGARGFPTDEEGKLVRAKLPREMNCSRTKAVPGTGAYSEEEFDQAARDIANFLHYVGEPGRLDRQRMGYWVLGFLALLFVLASALNREYWKDVH